MSRFEVPKKEGERTQLHQGRGAKREFYISLASPPVPRPKSLFATKEGKIKGRYSIGMGRSHRPHKDTILGSGGGGGGDGGIEGCF